MNHDIYNELVPMVVEQTTWRRASPEILIVVIFVVIEVELLHQGVYIATLLLGGAASASFAEYEDCLARSVEFVELLLRSDVEQIVGNELCTLTARYQIENLIGVGYGHTLYADYVALLHLA